MGWIIAVDKVQLENNKLSEVILNYFKLISIPKRVSKFKYVVNNKLTIKRPLKNANMVVYSSKVNSNINERLQVNYKKGTSIIVLEDLYKSSMNEPDDNFRAHYMLKHSKDHFGITGKVGSTLPDFSLHMIRPETTKPNSDIIELLYNINTNSVIIYSKVFYNTDIDRVKLYEIIFFTYYNVAILMDLILKVEKIYRSGVKDKEWILKELFSTLTNDAYDHFMSDVKVYLLEVLKNGVLKTDNFKIKTSAYPSGFITMLEEALQ